MRIAWRERATRWSALALIASVAALTTDLSAGFARAQLSGPVSSFEARYGLSRLASFPRQEWSHVPRRQVVSYPLGRFALPANAGQGPKAWYAGGLHIKISVGELEQHGRIYVSADTNERTFAQIEFERVITSRGRAVKWTSYDLFTGDRSGLTTRNVMIISFYNYLQNQGARPGENTVRLNVEQYHGAHVGSVSVYPDSGIFVTRRSPMPLTIDAQGLGDDPIIGQEIRFRVTVRPQLPQEAVKSVTIQADYDRIAWDLVAPKRAPFFNTVHGSRSVIYTFRPRQAGRHTITFGAISTLNSPHTGISIDVVSPQEGWFDGPLKWAGLGCVTRLIA